MKRWIAFLLAVTVVCALAACGSKKNTTDPNSGNVGESDSKETTQSVQQETKPEAEEWGVDDIKPLLYNSVSCNFGFKWPVVAGKPAMAAIAGQQNDGTLAFVDNYDSSFSPDITDIQQVFPAYTEQANLAFTKQYGSSYKDGAFTIESKEMVTIGEYEMCKFVGRHTFNLNDKDYDLYFVAYATKLKSNDGILYFLVEDITNEQSAAAQVDENAYKMASSLYELD